MTPEKRVRIRCVPLFFCECILPKPSLFICLHMRVRVWLCIFLCMCALVHPSPFCVNIPLYLMDRVVQSPAQNLYCSHSKLNGLLLLTGFQCCLEAHVTWVRNRAHRYCSYLLFVSLSQSFFISQLCCSFISLFSHSPVIVFSPKS